MIDYKSIIQNGREYHEKLKQQGKTKLEYEQTESYKVIMSRYKQQQYREKNKVKINARRRELRKVEKEVKPDNDGFENLYSGDFLGGFRGINSIDYEVINKVIKDGFKFRGIIHYVKNDDEIDKTYRFTDFSSFSLKLNEIIQRIFADPDGAGSMGNVLMSEVDKVWKRDETTKTLYWYVEIRHNPQ